MAQLMRDEVTLSIVVGDEVDHADHAVAAGHAHVALYAVGPSAVDRHEVVGLVERVGHDLGRNQLVLAEELQLLPLGLSGVLSHVAIEAPQLADLPLEIEVAQRELFVDARQREERANVGVPLVDLARDDVCRGKEHTALIAILLE